MSLVKSIKIPNNRRNNKNHHRPISSNSKGLDHKTIKNKLEILVKEKEWPAYVEKHSDIKNYFQVLLSEDDTTFNKKPSCLFSVICITGKNKGHYDFYSKNSGRLTTADIDPGSFSFGIKMLEGVEV